MNTWINYHHLYYFKAIAEEGSVSKAALKLRLGQPTLSAQLKQFEETLGVELFERQHKKLILTEQGRIALNYAQSIFQMGTEMYEALHDRMKPQKTFLCVGAIDSIPKQLVLQLAKSAQKISPTQLTLVEGKSDELLREVAAHRIDLLMTNFIPQEVSAKGLQHRVITTKPVAFYGAPKFKSLRKNFPQSLADQPVILPTYDSKIRYSIDEWRQSANVNYEILAESQDIAIKKLMAIEGMGLIPAATHTVTRQVLSGELIEIGILQNVKEDLVLVSAKRKIENPVAAQIMLNFKV